MPSRRSQPDRAAALRRQAARLLADARREADALFAMADEMDAEGVDAPAPVARKRIPESWTDAAHFIRENPGRKGDWIASEIGTSPANFRARIVPWLRENGFTSTPGEGGYYPPRNNGARTAQ